MTTEPESDPSEEETGESEATEEESDGSTIVTEVESVQFGSEDVPFTPQLEISGEPEVEIEPEMPIGDVD